MATTIVYAGTADDTAGGGHATYASVVATYVTADGKLWTGQLLDSGTYYIDQAFIAFDTSSIADTDAVSAVLLELWGNTNISTTDFTVEVAAHDWGTTVSTSDFRTSSQLSALTILATYDTSGFSTGAYKSFTSTGSFPAAISLTGLTKLIVFSQENRLASAPANYEEVVWTSADAAGTTNDPKLTVTHAASTTSGTGALTLAPAAVSGTGTVSIPGTGAVTLPAASVSGTGTETLTGTGAVTLAPAAVSGTGAESIPGTGALTLPTAAVTGTGTALTDATGTGALTLAPIAVAGVGDGGADEGPSGGYAPLYRPIPKRPPMVITGRGALILPRVRVTGRGGAVENEDWLFGLGLDLMEAIA